MLHYDFIYQGKRAYQEDALYVNRDKRFFAICDGVGGSSNGFYASNMILNLMHQQQKEIDKIKTSDELVELIKDIHIKFKNTCKKESITDTVATTLVLVKLNTEDALIAHLGDSPAFYFRNDLTLWSSKDHSVVQELFDAGVIKTEEEKKKHPYRNKITSYISNNHEELNTISTKVIRFQKDDLLLICSDGAVESFSKNSVKELFLNKSISLASRWDIFKCQAAKANDNSSAILIKI